MSWFKRIFFFMMVNVAVVVTVSVLLNIFGVRPYLNQQGLDLNALLAFCLIWGMAGSFISLLISRKMAKWFMGVKVIDPQTRDSTLSPLVQRVHTVARRAGLSTMPEVGIYESPDINAFATGPTKARSLVAVSTGLLRQMNDDQVEGVLAHEVAHIANGDMVTMTLLQGVMNAFVMFMARVLAYAIATFGSRDDDNRGFSHVTYALTTFVFEILFMFLGHLVIAWFSRQREFRADKGGAQFAGRQKMISALEALKINQQIPVAETHPSIKSLRISGGKSWMHLFSTHPPLEERIARLQHAGT